jgi:hypothetical protein
VNESAGKENWETPTLVPLGDLETLTAAGSKTGDDGAQVIS